jgi:hypothetical protein
MVVTKQGKAGKMSINYSFNYNLSQPTIMPDKLNSYDAAYYLNQGLANDGFSLWKKCCAGDDEALIHMEKYNRVDVEITRELYKRLRGFDNNAVNMAIMSDNVGAICTTCCSDDIEVLEDKFAFTPNGKYQVYVCNNCNTKLRSTSRIGDEVKIVKLFVFKYFEERLNESFKNK